MCACTLHVDHDCVRVMFWPPLAQAIPGQNSKLLFAYQVIFQAMDFVHRDGAVFLRDILAYQKLIQDIKGDRIEFPGSPNESFEPDREVVVSFPGIHGYAWNVLTNRWSNLLTSCIFLPDKTSLGYGQHPNGAACHCHHLYGEQKEWGCEWYVMWMAKTRAAAEAGCKLIVVTKMDGSLGFSQEGEVRFLRSSGYCFSTISIGLFASSISDVECQCCPSCCPSCWSCFWVCLWWIFRCLWWIFGILFCVLLVGPGLLYLVTFFLIEEPIRKCLGCSDPDVYNQTAEELWLNGTAVPGCPTLPSWYQPIRSSLSVVGLFYLIPAFGAGVIWWCSSIQQIFPSLPRLQVRDVCLAALENIWSAICWTVSQAIHAFNKIFDALIKKMTQPPLIESHNTLDMFVWARLTPDWQRETATIRCDWEKRCSPIMPFAIQFGLDVEKTMLRAGDIQCST